MAKSQLPMSVPEMVELLVRFNERASKLYEFSFHRQATGPGTGWKMQFTPKVEAEHRGADAESRSAVLLELRLLVQKRDQISFEQIVKLHELLPISDEQKQASRGSLSALEGYLSETCSAKFADWPFSRKELFEVYMFGKHAHLNPDKVPLANRLDGSKMAVAHQSDFEDIVLTYIEYALWYKAFNEKIIQSLAVSGGG